MKKPLIGLTYLLLGVGEVLAENSYHSKPLYEQIFDRADISKYISDGDYDKVGNYIDLDNWGLPSQAEFLGYGDCEDQAGHLWYLYYKNNIKARLVWGEVKSSGESGPHMWVELDYLGRTKILDTTYEGDKKGIFDKEDLKFQDELKYTAYDLENDPTRKLKLQNFIDEIISKDNFRRQNGFRDFSKINKDNSQNKNIHKPFIKFH
ncbi:hypothetical protein HOE04_00990 [archaeon]|jgi:hypothetical protein|nr:hypothetical protein [archaeon]